MDLRTNSMEWSHFRSLLFLRQSRNSPHFMEPYGSLLCSPVPMLNQTNPVQSCPISLKCVLILSPHLRIVLLSGLFPSGFHIKLCTHFSCPPYVLHACTRHSYSGNCPNIWRGTQVMKLLVTQDKTRTLHVYVTVCE